MKKLLVAQLFLLLVSLIISSVASAQDGFPYDKTIWPNDLRIRGNVIACGDGEVPKPIRDSFLQLAADTDAAIVTLWLGDEPDEATQKLKNEFKSAFRFDQYNISTDQTTLSDELKTKIGKATGIWIAGNAVSSSQQKLIQQLGTDIKKLIEDAGVVLFAGPVCEYLGYQVASSQGENDIQVVNGLNLIPDSVVSLAANTQANRAAIAMNPELVSIVIPKDTATILVGRKMRVFGTGKVKFRVMANDRKPFRTLEVPQASSRRVNPYREMVDLTAWRRDATDRSLPMFPPAEPNEPIVENGTLVIVGGGGMPRGLFDKFIELAGGKDAKLVYVPCTEAESVPAENGLISSWKGKVKSATLFHTKDREKADSDEEFLKPLAEATGIWFGGGRQWNFVDSYYGTKAHKLMHDVLKRGGVIGGSSAGASIQGDYLARANPVANFDIMAPGYERGLGFLQGVAIDQHFTQRGRQKDMTQLANTYPQLLGIGLDEATAIIVQKSKAEVVGRGEVFFYDRNQPVVPGEPDYVALGAGKKFDLVERKEIE